MKLGWTSINLDERSTANEINEVNTNIEKAMAAIPEKFFQVASVSRGTKRLDEKAIKSAVTAGGKPEQEYRFDNQPELFAVYHRGSMGNPQFGLFYVTLYAGFGSIYGVLLTNSSSNQLHVSYGSFNNGSDDYNFYKIKNMNGGRRRKHTRKHRKSRKHTRKH